MVQITSDLGGYVAFWRPVVIGAGAWAVLVLILLFLIWRK